MEICSNNKAKHRSQKLAFGIFRLLSPVSYTHLDVYKRQDETSEESGGRTVFSEIFFGMVHFFFIDKTHMPQTAVSKFVNNGTP